MKPTLRTISGSAPQSFGTAQYIWVKDGQLHGKTRVITVTEDTRGDPLPIIEWWTTSGHDDVELLLLPAHYVPNPLRPKPSYIVLCEVRDLKDHVVSWNTRSPLREREPKMSAAMILWLGISTAVRVFPEGKSNTVMETFLAAAIDSGILIHSITSTGFKVGPRMDDGTVTDPPSPLIVCDQYWIAWWMLQQVAKAAGATVVIDAGGDRRYYVSTKATRDTPKVARQVADSIHSSHTAKVYITAPERGFTTIQVTRDFEIDPYVVAADLVDKTFAVIYGGPRGTEESSDRGRPDFRREDNVDP